MQQAPHFPAGSQHDAAECLMYLLHTVDNGRMQQRVCGAHAAVSVEGMILCCAAEDAQVSREAPPVSMSAMIIASLTGESALVSAPLALVLRVENIYEQNEDYFAVDARADWGEAEIECTVKEDAEQCPRYRVEAYVAHVNAGEVPAQERMQSGHYVAYIHVLGTWV